jgi:hypothetical protein
MGTDYWFSHSSIIHESQRDACSEIVFVVTHFVMEMSARAKNIVDIAFF